MRYFFGPEPALTRVLFIESGSRALAEWTFLHLQALWGPDVQVDLVTCYGGAPAGFAEVFRIADYGGRPGRQRLVRELRARGYSAAGMICSGESIMTKWKWMIAARVPAKFFIVNENADYFWVQRQNLPVIRRFALVRAGLAGEGSVRTLIRLILFPFSLLFLILYAGFVHARRRVRMAFQ